MFSLAAPLFLWFGAVGLVPLVLHLYHRRKRVIARFSTNRFFTEAISQSQRRMQLQRWWLMLLRIAACLAVALAMARPSVRVAGLKGAAGRRDVVVVLDDSLSMRATVSGGAGERRTRFEQARAVAAGVLRGLDRRDRAALVTYGGKTVGAPERSGAGLTRDKARLMGELRMLVPTCGSGDPFRALGEAARMFDSPRQRARLLVVITDMQDGQWPHSTWPQPRSRIPARIVQVGRPPQDNVWIAAAGLSQAVVVSGQPNSLEVEIRNGFGGAQRAELLVELDGKPLAHRSLELAANAGTRVDIPFGLDVPARKNGDREDTAAAAARPESESHTLVGRLAREDALAEDNVFYLTARSVSRLPVLLVDGAASGGSRRASSYLRTALHALSREESLRVDNVSLADLDGVDLGPYRLVILSGVSALNEGPLARIEEHVQAGHGLLIFLDASADPRFYNDVEARRPLGGFMQASIGEIVATPPEADPMHVTDAEWEHDVLRRFRGPLRSAVAGIAFRRVYRARPRGAITVASLADDLPLMLERRYGQGRAILFASSPQPEWSDLPLRRNFVSLLNHLTTYLAAGTAPHPDRDVGQELVVSADWKAQGKPAAVTGPDGRTIEAHLRPCGSRVVAYVAANSVSEPGFYRGRTAAVQSGPDAGVAGESWVSAVNCPRGESTPAATTVERMRPFCGGWELAHVDLSAGGSAAPGDDRIATEVLGSAETARGLWDTLLWVTLAVLVLEPFVANRASGGVRRADPSQGGAAP